MAGRDRGGEPPFRDTRRDWITDRAPRRNEFERDRSPIKYSRERDIVWDNDRLNRDERKDRCRSRSPDRNRDRNKSGRNSFEREMKSDYSVDRDRFARDRGRGIRKSRDRSPVRSRPYDNNRGMGGHSSLERLDNDRGFVDGRDRFGRDEIGNRDRKSSEKSSLIDENRKPRGHDSPVGGSVDNWGRELRLGGSENPRARPSPDKVRLDRWNIPDKRRSRDNSRDRGQVARNRESDWKKSTDEFLARGSRGNSPGSRGPSRDKGDIPVRESLKHGSKTDEDWNREPRKYERGRSRLNKQDSDEVLDPNCQNFSNRKPLDHSNSMHRSRDYPQESRSRAPTIPSPKRNKSRDGTPVIDENSGGEDMVISDDDNNDEAFRIGDNKRRIRLSKYDYSAEEPEKNIVVRRLPPHITEVDLHLDITSCNLACRDIRLMRRKETGVSRGFAFVEFNSVIDATVWMEMRKRVLKFGKFECTMEYRESKGPPTAQPKFTKDWICSKCHAHNFGRRLVCYICNASRTFEDVEEPNISGSSEYPTNTVVLIGLSALTSEENVLKSVASLSDLPMRSVRIVRDPATNLSKGACCMEMNSILDAYNLYKSLNENIPEIDGVRPVVKYWKPESNQNIPRSSAKVNVPVQWSQASAKNISGSPGKYTLADVPKLADYSAALYAKTPQETIAYRSYYQNYYKKQISDGIPIHLPVDSAAGLATAQASLASSLSSSVPALAEPPDGSGTTTYPTPDQSTYQYEPSSGFYYDPYTTLYFDANSQNYFNSKLGKYLYWDSVRHTYLPSPSGDQVPNMSNDNRDNDSSVGQPHPVHRQEEKKKIKEREGVRVKTAKMIAKDMEKWAKTLNQKKETAKQISTPTTINAPTRYASSAAAADIGFAVLERKDHLSTLGNYHHPIPVRNEEPVRTRPVPTATESDDEDDPGEDKSHTDWEKLICLLCKRQLGSKEALIKHQQISDLHKQNLAAWFRSRGVDPEEAQRRQNQYRDRANERRQKHFVPDAPKPSRLKESYVKSLEVAYEQPTTTGIKSDNLGNKLLQKMGWQEGMGLGKSNQGRTSIIEASSRSKTAGLGSRPSGITRGPGDTYKDCVKKMMAIRYAQLEEQ